MEGVNAWTAQENDFDQQLIIDLGTTKNVTRIWTQGRAGSNEFVEEYRISYGSNGLDYVQYKEAGGTSAWTPLESTYYQHLTVNLTKRKELRAIAIRGRYGSNDYVTEYVLQYSDDGESWRTYSSQKGDAQMFEGNSDGNSINKNEFEVPIIAQYIRINPMRWRDKISMRVELYGCDYAADTVYFNGSSLLKLDLLRDPISASRETMRFRFKTSTASGVLIYSRGTQGDYLALQLRDNRLLLNIDLGSGIATSLSVGSLLDDNIWHDVAISRNRRDIVFSVDRVIVQGRIKGEFSRLNLNRAIYIGGVPNFQEGLVVNQNFTGCIENMYLNATSVIQELKQGYEIGEPLKFQKINTFFSCPEPPIAPITFLKEGSYAKLRGYSDGNTLNVSLEFRTYETHGLLIYHKFKTEGHVKVFLEEGRVKVELYTKDMIKDSSPKIKLDNYAEQFNDGRWHPLMLTMAPDSLTLSIDYRPVKTIKKLKFLTGGTYYIAGGITPPRGFIGCMRRIAVDGNYRLPSDWKKEDYCCPNEVVFDACQMIDRCNPNPCEHGGLCTQTSNEFICNCHGTGYAGAVCHTSIHPLSCTAYKNAQSVSRSAEISIDVDGSGSLDAFPVTCEFYSDGRIITAVQHSVSSSTTVDGYQEPGSFRQDITYDASRAQLEALLNRSHTCTQHLEYACKHSRLLNSPSDEASFHPFAWWVSREGQRMDYWAGAQPGSRMCQCGVLGSCTDPTKWCNCDAEYNPLKPDEYQSDGGEIMEKEFLPVKQVRFGDTGSHLDEKEGRYTLGPLLCEGDDLFSSVVTFRISGAVIRLPPFDFGHSGDIYFEFKTTKENAVLFHAEGIQDFIKLSIIGGDQLQFQFQVGDTPLGVSVETSGRLADNKWHSVSIERNRKEARLVVDGALKNEIRTSKDPIRALQINSDLILGAAILDKEQSTSDGFLGCMRALLLNGRPIDLRAYARRVNKEEKVYGVNERTNANKKDYEWWNFSVMSIIVRSAKRDSLKDKLKAEIFGRFLGKQNFSWNMVKKALNDSETLCMNVIRSNNECLLNEENHVKECWKNDFESVFACEDTVSGLYGISEGCHGKCSSNPCLNNGTCLEGYDSYTCDCRWTSFKGPICADEIGVNLRPNSSIKYDFQGSWRSTIAEKIRVGFTTINPQGFLLGFSSQISGEYLTIMVSNSGHLRVVFDFGFERQEIIFPGKHFGLGQYHDLRLSRKDSGATMVLQVDNQEIKEYHFNIKESADAQFNNIQYMYIGRNESMKEGFVGCVSRVEFDDIYPLKLLFQQDGPSNVRSIGDIVYEDFCGVEPVTHPPEPVEARPAPPVDLVTGENLHRTDEAILGTMLVIIFIVLVVVAMVVVRALSRHKGEYLTQEERGADGAPDPDTAALAAATGPRVTKRREFFI
ncbi:Neurexin-4 [Eumeta japonica]|uniref:Neurexin-4 n=1 Tax=Eumeta variegata TaxID=151549 RepID=A0A4C1T812_EUMVA|nr:Neurexin-4 [Eumeta japonica]